MKVLVIEDEPRLAQYLKRGLTEIGFSVSIAHNGRDGLHMALEGEFDLLVLDLRLPEIDGLSLLRILRKTKQTPVLILSAQARVEDRVKGLESGADDYLVKPFAFTELRARMTALLRRFAVGVPGAKGALRIGDLEINVGSHRVLRAGVRLDVTPNEFRLLLFLAGRAGEVVSREKIAGHVWDMELDRATGVVEVAVRRLRAKIDDPFPIKLIHTVRGVGYVLEVREL